MSATTSITASMSAPGGSTRGRWHDTGTSRGGGRGEKGNRRRRVAIWVRAREGGQGPEGRGRGERDRG